MFDSPKSSDNLFNGNKPANNASIGIRSVQPRVSSGYHIVSLLSLFFVMMLNSHYRYSLFNSSLTYIIDL